MWMFKCQDVSELVSRSMDQRLSLYEKIGVRVHLMMCRYCSRFEKQLRQIRFMIQNTSETVVPKKLDEKKKNELKKILNKQE